MFKLPVPEDQEKLIEAYKTLAKDQQKVSLDFSTAVFVLCTHPIAQTGELHYITFTRTHSLAHWSAHCSVA